jgi:tRNA 2-thiouridine synthesizing protein A
MTYVRTKLTLEALSEGELLEVRLRGDEPRDNLPRSVSEEGHQVLSMIEEPGGAFRLLLRKKQEK